jgi:hypothetical protein
MKTKTKTKTKACPSIAALLAAAAAVSFLHAEPQAAPTPEAAAQQKVSTQIFARVSTERLSFSRAMPMPLKRLEFQTPLMVNGEMRMPFAIVSVADPKKALWQGYVRLEDQEIFLCDAATGDFRLAASFPRFAPTPTIANEQNR